MRSDTFQRGFLLLLVVAVSALFFWMIRDLFMTLLFGALFSSLLRPMFLRFRSWTGGRARLASLLTLLVFILGVALPLAGFLGLVAKQAVSVTETVKPWVEENLSNKQDIDDRLRQVPGYRYFARYREPIIRRVSTAVGAVGNFIFQSASALTAGTLVFFLQFAIMLYAMFFFFIDGPAMLEKILYCMPLKRQDEKKLLDGFRSMARATLKGLVLIGVAQGALAGLALWMAGSQSPLFWGTLMAVLSVIPNIGSALVWVPACILLFIKGKTVAAVLVFLWCALVVGSVDNVLRPILVGRGTTVPQLLILISTLGGLSMMGLSGFVLGPVLALIFLTVWDIYATAFKDVLPE